MADAELLTHALVSPRLDYCNVLSTSNKSLQMSQDAAATILTKTGKPYNGREFAHLSCLWVACPLHGGEEVVWPPRQFVILGYIIKIYFT